MTSRGHPRVIRLAHVSPGRLRLRLRWLRDDRAAATGLADHLADCEGVIEVAVRPRTGSVLCLFEPHRTSAGKLLAGVRRYTGVATILRPEEGLPSVMRGARPRGSILGRLLAGAFRGLDDDLYEASGGRIDLGTLAGLSLLVAGAAEIAATRRLAAPPWFSLAWWAFRTFTMFETETAGAAPTAPRPTNEAVVRRAARRRGRGV
jgi:hypothetical protein